ncbi:EamA family transporter [Microbacterium betulae]|uniref:EamA family transporter n=1 Tax=Microbacterium betulae TaxID=2981139 RepID=A0AA97FHU8_9MICO|nr:EamA family transporter [Microbacterium sp. AB]WOF23305.1 EamA family transporter [Microbacterium sp. AB]
MAASTGLIIGSCVSLQFGAALAVQLFPALGSWGVTALRLSIAAIVVLVAVRPRIARWSRDQWIAVTAFGLALGAMNGFFYASLERIPLGAAVAIEFLGPLVLAAFLTRRMLDVAWVGVALAGMALLGVDSAMGSGSLDPLGVAFALVAAGFWALYIRTSARVGRVIPGMGGLAIALLIASVALLPFGVPAVGVVAADPRLLALAVGTALLASVVPYTLELMALRRLPQRVFGVLLSLEPVVAAAAGWLLLGQQAGPLRLTAIALVVVASAGTALAARRSGEAVVGDAVATPTGAIPLPPARPAAGPSAGDERG